MQCYDDTGLMGNFLDPIARVWSDTKPSYSYNVYKKRERREKKKIQKKNEQLLSNKQL